MPNCSNRESCPWLLIRSRFSLSAHGDGGDVSGCLLFVVGPGTGGSAGSRAYGGFYDGGRFHRTVKPDNQPNNNVKIEVIQASINADRGKDGFPPIPLERTSVTGLLHKDGTISMATSGPDTATFDFFICIGDQPSLDFGGAQPGWSRVRGVRRVTKGMDMVRRIQAAPTDKAPSNPQSLNPPIRIISVRRLPSRRQNLGTSRGSHQHFCRKSFRPVNLHTLSINFTHSRDYVSRRQSAMAQALIMIKRIPFRRSVGKLYRTALCAATLPDLLDNL
jgi:peptidyl-prolyl cis-trans isomerase A (cyclophilin A)